MTFEGSGALISKIKRISICIYFGVYKIIHFAEKYGLKCIQLYPLLILIWTLDDLVCLISGIKIYGAPTVLNHP